MGKAPIEGRRQKAEDGRREIGRSNDECGMMNDDLKPDRITTND
jgi:hypothetical protein